MSAFVLPIISTLAGLFGNRPKETTQTTNSNSSGSNSSNFNNFQAPVLSDFQEGLAKTLVPGAINRFNQGPADLRGYEANAIQNNNAQGDVQSQIAKNIAAARGLSYSPAGTGTLNNIEQNRLNQNTAISNSLPLLQRQQQGDDLANLMKAFGILPTGQVGSGNQDSQFEQSGTQKTVGIAPGNMLGGALGGLGAGLAAPDPNGGQGNILGNILKMFGGG